MSGQTWHRFGDKPTTARPEGEGWAWISGEWKRVRVATDAGDGVPDKLNLPKSKPSTK